MPKTDTQKQDEKQKKREEKALKRKEKKIGKYMKKRKRKITPEMLKAREDNLSETKSCLDDIRTIDRTMKRIQAFIDELQKKIKQLENEKEKHKSEIYDNIIHLSVLNPGSCHRCGLFGGHKPYKQCDEITESELVGEDFFMDEDYYPIPLRWMKEPTDEYVKKVYESLYEESD